MSRKRPRIAAREAALKGAIAGAVGGAAMLFADRLADHHVLRRDGSPLLEWEQVVRRSARRAGLRPGRRTRTAGAVAAHLAFSATVGAAFGVAVTRRQLPAPVKAFFEGALTLAAYATTRSLTGRGRRARVARAVLPIEPYQLFALATDATLRSLTRQRTRR